MTRDFNKQRRDDTRPSSRNQSPNRRGPEQPSRPARPRLNREMVDRGWETGAPSRHADYRAANNNGRPARNTQWNNRSSDNNGRNSYGNRQENNRGFERTPNGPRPSFGPQSSHSPQSRPFTERRGYSDKPREYNDRPGYQDNRRSYGQRNQFGQSEQRREGSGNFNRDNRPSGNFNRDSRSSDSFNRNSRPSGNFNRDNRPSGNFNRNSRPSGNFNRDNRPSQNMERDNRAPRRFERNNRDSRSASEPQHLDAMNPRWQSRPTTFHQQHERDKQPPQQEQFEGDYERFGSVAQPSSERPQRKSYRDRHTSSQERSVTRLPDGRVIKGARSVQRKNAAFWTDVSQDAEKLVPKSTEEKPRKARTRSASAVARTRKGAAKEGKVKHQGKIPKPSQRGFKWPTS
ncbi:MAG: hypothetical protein M3Z24_10820 [Chloroflexota bacterium]|nr:hypothetical protein [Chloroflexota bacterium]